MISDELLFAEEIETNLQLIHLGRSLDLYEINVNPGLTRQLMFDLRVQFENPTMVLDEVTSKFSKCEFFLRKKNVFIQKGFKRKTWSSLVKFASLRIKISPYKLSR